ncbi:MAG: efflux RND transporter permease subunit [Halioglobus sp.]
MFEKIIQRGNIMTVTVLIVCVLGIVAALRIPVQMIPDLDVRVISVRTNWPGATPQDVEKEILIEQEEYLRNLPNLSRITARANSGRAEIELEFPHGTDITQMLIRVNNALSQVPSYPETVDEPRIYANSFSSNAFMFFSITPLPDNPRAIDIGLSLDFVEDTVKPRLGGVPGISEVGVWGGVERQIQILIDPARLAQRELTLTAVREVIRSRNSDRSGGMIDAGKRQYLLRTVGRFENLDELSDLVLARRGDAVIRLSDVATVQLDHFEEQSMTSFNGAPNLFVTLRREAGSNVIEIKEGILKEVETLNQNVLEPAGLRMHHMSDDVVYVSESLRNVWQNLIMGAILASVVMFLFLRSIPVTLVGVMGIPICIIVAFLGLMLAGRTINVISLAGIAFAIGMTLDNSIVVLESIALERRKGAKRFQAAVEGVRHVWPAVLASTLTTVLVFIPVAFVEQEAGQLYSDVAIAISAAILASMLVAVTVLPTAAAHLNFSSKEKSTGDPEVSRGRHHNQIHRFTLSCVHAVLATPRSRTSCIAIAVLLSGGIIWFLTPPAEYLPEGEEAKVFAVMSAPPGYSLETMKDIAKDIEGYLLPHVRADRANFRAGKTDFPPMAYSNLRVGSGSLRIISEPMEAGDVEALMDALARKFGEYPGMRAFASRGSIISSNNGGTRSINLDIAGNDLGEIYTVAEAAYRRAEEVFDNPRIQSQPSALSLSQPLLEIRPNWERAAELGLSASDIGFTVAALTDGSYVDEFFLEDDKLDIYLYSELGRGVELESLSQLPIYTQTGEVLPLGALVDVVETVDSNSFRRVNGRRTVSLSIIPPRSIPLETGVETVREDIVSYLRNSGDLPANVDVVISGAADQLDATRESLMSNYMVALLIVYLLMVAIFNHWSYPLLIITSIPLGIAGGIVGLSLLNGIGGLLPVFGGTAIVQPFDMISMLGFLILMGTVVNNPILVVHRTVENVREKGMDALAAATEAVEVRLRPIAMSTITTLVGLAPLVLIPGAGTELYRGVGAIVMFGIIGAALVTLTVLPAMTVIVLQLGRSKV